MVQLMKSGGEFRKGKMVVKMEQQGIERGDLAMPHSQYNPLEEPSPLGLRLRKSPSLLELIQMRLSQTNASKALTQNKKDQKGTGPSATTEKLKASIFLASILRIGTWEVSYIFLSLLIQKHVVSLIMTGSVWLFVSISQDIYEGDLVAKCYFAKHKLVWEVLDGGLKKKIEIQWSDIMALKENYLDDGPGTLDVVEIYFQLEWGSQRRIRRW